MGIKKDIINVGIGTGLTTIWDKTEGRKAIVQQLTFTNKAAAKRTVELYDGTTTTGIRHILTIILTAEATLTPAEVQYREIEYEDLVGKCLEGTEVSVSGHLIEE